MLSEVHRLRSLVKNRDEIIHRLMEEKGRIGKDIENYHLKLAKLDQENKELKDTPEKIVTALGVRDINQAFDKISQIVHHGEDLTRAGELVGRIGVLIAELSPPGSFVSNVPSHTQIWTWIANLVSQFMKYKQASQILCELSALLGVSPGHLVKKVRSLIHN